MMITAIQRCQTCASKQSLHQPVSGKTIVVNGVMERVQIDLFDMSSIPDGELRYVMQVYAIIILIK